MKTKEIIDILTRYNDWRRGANIEQPDPEEIGRAIDYAIKRLIELEGLKWKSLPQ